MLQATCTPTARTGRDGTGREAVPSQRL